MDLLVRIPSPIPKSPITPSRFSKYLMDLVHVVVENSGQFLEWYEVRLHLCHPQLAIY